MELKQKRISNLLLNSVFRNGFNLWNYQNYIKEGLYPSEYLTPNVDLFPIPKEEKFEFIRVNNSENVKDYTRSGSAVEFYDIGYLSSNPILAKGNREYTISGKLYLQSSNQNVRIVVEEYDCYPTLLEVKDNLYQPIKTTIIPYDNLETGWMDYTEKIVTESNTKSIVYSVQVTQLEEGVILLSDNMVVEGDLDLFWMPAYNEVYGEGVSVDETGILVNQLQVNESVSIKLGDKKSTFTRKEDGLYFKENGYSTASGELEIKMPIIHTGTGSQPPSYWKDGQFYAQIQKKQSFTSNRFPQDFGTSFTWDKLRPDAYTSMKTTSNTMIEQFYVSGYRGDTGSSPYYVFDGVAAWNNFFESYGRVFPNTWIMKFNGDITFEAFRLYGWGMDHEIGSSPKSFIMEVSTDGIQWEEVYSTDNFEDTHKKWSSWTAMDKKNNKRFNWLRINWLATHDDDLSLKFSEIEFKVTGEKYLND